MKYYLNKWEININNQMGEESKNKTRKGGKGLLKKMNNSPRKSLKKLNRSSGDDNDDSLRVK